MKDEAATRLPGRLQIGDEVYVATVLKVTGKDPDGSPRVFELLREDESVSLAGGEQFFVVYALASMSRRNH